jgi:hypothetical protein
MFQIAQSASSTSKLGERRPAVTGDEDPESDIWRNLSASPSRKSVHLAAEGWSQLTPIEEGVVIGPDQILIQQIKLILCRPEWPTSGNRFFAAPSARALPPRHHQC